MLNLVGLGIGVTSAGVVIDVLERNGVAEPYTWTLLTFTIVASLAIPLFFFAGRRFHGDRDRLFSEMNDGML
jgi:hypothetical protein